MSFQSWQETLVSAPGDGTALTASTTPTSLLTGAGGSPAVFTLPQNFFTRVGQQLRVFASGRISNIVTAPGTLTLDVRFGGIVVANGGAMALNIVAKTNVPWWLDWLLTCRSIGSGTLATMMHQGIWTSESVIGSPLPSVGGAGQHMLPNAAPAVGTGFSSVGAQAVDLFATWSLNNANSIQLHQFKLTAIN